MHIAVVLRIVPDLSEDFDISEDGTDIDREWVGLKLNEFDDHALEVVEDGAYGFMPRAGIFHSRRFQRQKSFVVHHRPIKNRMAVAAV